MLRVAHAAWADAQAGGKLTTEWSEGTFEGAGRERRMNVRTRWTAAFSTVTTSETDDAFRVLHCHNRRCFRVLHCTTI